MTMQWAWLRLIAAMGVMVCLAVPSVAQEFRATVTGRIADASELAVPGATVTITNTQTAEVTSVATSDDGAYSVPFLRPGVYTLRAELAGFKTYLQEKLELQVGQTATINIRMEVGELSEQITVTADAVDSSKADRGMVIDNKRVTELPLNARNPFMLSTLAPGITYNGPAIYQRPFDNGAIADWSINGGANRNNEFLLDGAPNNALQGGNNIAYVPPVDSVQEFKIITNSYDAQYGRTAGGVVNVSLKSGTNSFHGTAYEFARRKAWDASEVLFNANNREKPDHKLDQYGFQIDGPVIRNKLFFSFQYEGYDESTPNPATLTVPQPDFVRGDFSNLRDAQGRLITIYDPLTGRNVNGQWVRDPFPGNQIPANRINPVAGQAAGYFLQPNQTSTSGNPWQGNYLFAPNLAVDDFYNIATKVDLNVSDKTRMYVRYGQNYREEIRYVNGILSGPAQDGQLPLERINYTGVWDMVRTTGSSLVWNIRTGLNQYVEAARTDAGLGFNASELGFPSSFAGQVPIEMFPRFQFSDSYSTLGRGNFNRETSTVLSVQPNATMVKGRHTMRAGLDARVTWFAQTPSGAGGGQFNFDRGFTQANFQQGDPLSGHPIASFLLGYPSAANTFVDNNLFPEFRWNYFAPWFQDDWQINNRLTLNLGFRWDFNTPVWEEQDRINFGFDPSVVNPVSSRVNQAQFPGYRVNGGLGFVGQGSAPERYPYQYDKSNIQPRVGFAYMLTDKTIVRGGVGRYFLNVTGTTTQNGFSIQTPYIASTDDNRTPAASLSNPYPSGIAQPPGSDLGLETFLGRGFGFSNTQFINPYVNQFSIGVQRLLPWRTTVEISYVGSRSKDQQSQWGGYNEPSN
ncbi:MAG: carboxypeptidase regulatory-like domain-containing protein, partial [Acidobacteria bacterium]|nr:carboxypeptidase regulatory-like domain-containing protein [Acidobacteriota bacterium]